MLLMPWVAAAGVASSEEPPLVPAEEYPLFDRVVTTKFLTSQTRMVVFERLTTTHLHPEEDRPPSIALFEERGFFDGRLPRDLIHDFVVKNQRPSKLEARFSIASRYRFVSRDGTPESDTGVMVLPARWRVTGGPYDPETIDRLAFARAGLTLRGDQALVYVANYRPDGTGGGFLVWLVRRDGAWQVYDTDVVWVAKSDGGRPEAQ
mgnify:FL=1